MRLKAFAREGSTPIKSNMISSSLSSLILKDVFLMKCLSDC